MNSNLTLKQLKQNKMKTNPMNTRLHFTSIWKPHGKRSSYKFHTLCRSGKKKCEIFSYEISIRKILFDEAFAVL